MSIDLASLEHQQQQLREAILLSLDHLEQWEENNSYYPSVTTNFDVLVAHCEINDSHGVGVLLKRIFSDSSQILSLRSHDLYDGRQSFGKFNYCLAYNHQTRSQILQTVAETFQDHRPRRILCVPYFSDDLLTAIALKDLFNVPLCTYLMDDQNIYVQNIPDELMGELLEKSDLCLGISQDLCQAYEQKYHHKFWFLPPVAPQSLIQTVDSSNASLKESKKGVIIGNIWSQQWLDRLAEVTAQSKIKIDWYGNPNRDWLKFDEQELSQKGIQFKGYLPTESQLVSVLREASFAVIPTAESEELSDRVELAKLSLPSRIPFMVATANLPLLVVGNSDTGAARFVERFKLGRVCQYQTESFQQAVDWVNLTENQQIIRQKAAQLAVSLSSEGISDWIWQSLAQKSPKDQRFERLGATLNEATVVITPNEVNQKHGTGALVKRIIADTPNIISMRSDNHYGGEHDFGEISFCLPKKGITRLQAYEIVSKVLQGCSIKQIFCVPYYVDDLYLAIAVKDLYDVPLVTYIMDDQNISVNNIPDRLMREFLNKCSFRLATHPELRDAYENKYGLKFWLLPAVVPHAYVNTVTTFPDAQNIKTQRGALLGSIWSPKWFEMLSDTVKGANLQLDWFGNVSYWWLQKSPEELAKTTGITPFGVLDESALAEKLKNYPYVVVPTGTLDERDDCQNLSQLSLPGRIIFALVASNTPIIILGSEKTGAAHFVKRFGIGLTCDYESQAFADVVNQITQSNTQKEMRQNAAKVAEKFSDKGVKDWIWQSLAQERPTDLRFENLLSRVENDLVHYIEAPVPHDIYKDYIPVYYVMRRLSEQGYRPDFIVDVGSSHGIWSHTASKFFKEASYILIDPLMTKYEQAARDFYLKQIPNSQLLELAVSNQNGKTTFQVSPDLYGSSLLNPADYRTYETVEVEVLTLDQIAETYQVKGRGILKLDVQCAEHIVLEGAKTFLKQVDAIVVELSLVRYDAKALVFLEMLNLLDSLGFRYYDETGEWRSPVNGTLLQKEIVFLRQDLLVFQTSDHSS